MSEVIEKVQQKRNIAIATPNLGEEEWLALKEPLISGWLTQGPKVKAFEQAFAKRHQVKHALAVTSCTTALHLALATMDIGPGDEVIIPAFTWVATANVVLHTGATPIFADVDRYTYNLCIESVREKLTERTKAIIPVHLFGLCADMQALKKVLPADVKILEDAACAAGASYRGTPAGGLGDMAAFSFHPRKSITTGEGGMLTTNDDALAAKAEILRNHGADISEEVRHHGPKPYLLPDFKYLGFNYRMTDLQAAVGLVQLNKLDKIIQQRQQWADYYRQQLADINWLLPQALPEVPGQHAWQAFVCYVDPQKAPMPRNQMMEILQSKGISTRPGTHAVHMLSYYREKYGFTADQFPGARDCDRYTLAIPLHNNMTQDDYDYVINALHLI
jgi:perosamine synthetase